MAAQLCIEWHIFVVDLSSCLFLSSGRGVPTVSPSGIDNLAHGENQTADVVDDEIEERSVQDEV